MPQYMTIEDRDHALKILGERRLWDREYKPPNPVSKLFKSQRKLEAFSPQEIDRALRAAVQENASLGLIEAYISLGASVGVRPVKHLWKRSRHARSTESDALQLAFPGSSEDLFRLLATHADQKSKDEALVTAIRLHDESKTKTIFELGARPLIFDTAICRAAARLDEETLSFLSRWTSRSKEVYTIAFARAIQASEQWFSDSRLNILRMLLEKGAEGDVVDVTFLQAVQHFLIGRAPEALVDLLLSFDVDVDFNDGEVVKRTVATGEIDMLKKLMGSDPSTDTLTNALFCALMHQHPPELVVQISEILTTSEQQPLLTGSPNPNLPLLVFALQKYPTSPEVVRQLLVMGCEGDSQLAWQVFSMPKVQAGDGHAQIE
ncbi:hypothetical protein H2200_001868 [Cladophialophora chaetospira]|uniref:Uncharacterized protein n=1 Tax=Cladophialophora chaetospira TaxID=386627 RepID=A0AA39CPG8_9EURO|nr:hypothetical protein H2200_001868 [Cladophialophora chaetospira]